MTEEIFDINDLLGDNSDFELPRLEEFTKIQNPREATLVSCRTRGGRFGEMAILTFKVGTKEETYRTYCKIVVEEVNDLLEHDKFPVLVNVKSFPNKKSDYPSISLNG